MPEHTGEGECVEVSPEAAVVLDAVERAVGSVMQRMYEGCPVDDTGHLEAEITGYIRHTFYMMGVEIEDDIVFTRGCDEERGNWINAAVRLKPESRDILIEFVKCHPDVDDGFGD